MTPVCHSGVRTPLCTLPCMQSAISVPHDIHLLLQPRGTDLQHGLAASSNLLFGVRASEDQRRAKKSSGRVGDDGLGLGLRRVRVEIKLACALRSYIAAALPQHRGRLNRGHDCDCDRNYDCDRNHDCDRAYYCDCDHDWEYDRDHYRAYYCDCVTV